MGNPYAPRKKAEAKSEETSTAAEETPQTPDNGPEESGADKSESNALQVPDTTMEGVLDWVGDDKEKAALAIEHEKSQPKPRKTLLNKLGDI